MGLRSSLAITAGRLTRWGLSKVLRRNASQLPGRVALALDPTLMGRLAERATWGSVVVCGTNGKTTTNNLIADALEAGGRSVLCNRIGANMAPGVVSALLTARSADVAVIEADELSTVRILPSLRPRYLVLLNLFRDQLDRAGEIDHVQDVIVRALSLSPQTALVINGDDPLCAAVARRAHEAGTRVLAFGIDEDLHLSADRVPEARFCPACGAELEYAFRSYAQLGSYRCPRCDFRRPALDVAARAVTVGREGVAFDLVMPSRPTRHLHAGFGGTYMVYNLLAVCAAVSLVGGGVDDVQRALERYRPQNGRLQHFDVGGREVILNLAKNPTGLNQNLSLLAADDREKAVFVVVNDNPNDGTDVSWVWDVDFERLLDQRVSRVHVGGTRANDVQVRLKYAGIKAEVARGVTEVVGRLGDLPVSVPLYVLTNYSALAGAKAELTRLGGDR
ncbi:MurT ligase domain-containing protein [Olsenella sp. HMSC062G07]|uniref:MurT ligase domain-containing protein n=1 Tax=Olsenella sp. HMSC062G07 TaxID=1739330 RepID=UPI0008A29772|nr:MurT ligase domain-containing protein [Olsenella sp. HMSC062G07]OFK24786.1 UDP-N-acetylmuramoylalanyl-D-glutamate--2,6-diaminopimelate ligase [Olsenella sp. HMSC062G07]